MDRTKLAMMGARYEAEALSYSGSYRTVVLLGMQMCAAALGGVLYRFSQTSPEGQFNVALGWPDPVKFAPPDLGCR